MSDPIAHLAELSRMHAEKDAVIADLRAEIEKLRVAYEDIRRENYDDLYDQMIEAWGLYPGQQIGAAELNAFMASRRVHTPSNRLRDELKRLREAFKET